MLESARTSNCLVTCVPGDKATVAVIITTFNHARFLAEAIESIRAQTRAANEIIVVDDGSTDDPASVVGHFPNVKLIRQDNRGPSAARNTGLRHCDATYVTFLDADDRFLPVAIESGLSCITGRPRCAFVYGGYRLISEDGHPIGPDQFNPINGDAHLALLHANLIVAHDAVLYRRDRLLEVNGFDELLRRGEDYDLYLRLVKDWPIGSHPEAVVEYRRHGSNVSSNYLAMLSGVLKVVARHETRIGSDPVAMAALREGKTNRRKYYVSKALAAALDRSNKSQNVTALVRDYIQAARWDPGLALRILLGPMGSNASKVLPRSVVQGIEWLRGRHR
jgi:glycosyltransferase involved in cell wall biosynthesis